MMKMSEQNVRVGLFVMSGNVMVISEAHRPWTSPSYIGWHISYATAVQWNAIWHHKCNINPKNTFAFDITLWLTITIGNTLVIL